MIQEVERNYRIFAGIDTIAPLREDNEPVYTQVHLQVKWGVIKVVHGSSGCQHMWSIL
jgi:hypothetical protein